MESEPTKPKQKAPRRELIRQTRKCGTAGWSHEETYRGLHVGSLVHRARLRAILDTIGTLRPATSGSIADFGCSDGYILSVMREHAPWLREWDIVGFDKKRDLLERARSRKIPRASFEYLDLNEPSSVQANRFDLVMCLETLEHTGDCSVATLNVARSCKVGGHLLVSAPTEMGWRGLVKFFGRKAFQADPYGDFFMGKSQWRYMRCVFFNGDVQQFRQPPRDGWGPHLGFNIYDFESFLTEQLIAAGHYRLERTRKSFLGFNRLYLIRRVA